MTGEEHAVAVRTAVAQTLPPQVEARSSLSPDATLPLWLWPVAIGVSGLGFVTANPMLTALGVLLVPLLVTLLWRSGEPPILLACCLMQWLQVMMPVFDADLLGTQLEVVSSVSTHDQATWLSLAGVLAVAVGMRLALNHRLGAAAQQMELEFGKLSLSSVFVAYLVSLGVAYVSESLAWGLGGLAQLVLALSSLKWALLWILLACVLVQGRGYRFTVAALLLEVGIGFLGYFASFKEAFFLLAIAMFSIRRRIAWAVRAWMGLGVMLLLATMVFWQAIKIDYRNFVNKGQGDQAVRVSVEARIEKLGQLLASVDSVAIERGLETLVDRVGYTELFAATLEWVPANEPHAGGELLKAAILHPLMPRLLFPNKEAINDSERARRFSGLTLSGSEEGTSIGIGLMAESYADFGPALMFLPLLLLGYLFGRVYRVFRGNLVSTVWGVALAIGVFFTTMRGVEISGVKLLGGMLTAGLVMFALNRFFGRGIFQFLSGGKASGVGQSVR